MYAALIGVSIYAVLVAYPEELARIRADGIATVFYVANWHAIYAGHDYWEMFGAPSPLDHTWSLAIEEQFYLLCPPLAYWVLRRSEGSTRSLAALSLGLALLSAAWMIYQFDASEGTARLYFGTDTRAAATLLGAALAAILRPSIRRWPQESRPGADALAWLGIATLGWAWGNLGGQIPAVYQGALFILSISGVCVIGGAVLAPQGLAARLFSLAPLRMLGVVSYRVYLWHWPNLSSDQLKDLFQRNSECQNRVRREVAEQTGALLLDLDAYLCPHRRCRREMNGVRLRSDGLHFRGPGARLISTWLLDQIEALKTPQSGSGA